MRKLRKTEEEKILYKDLSYDINRVLFDVRKNLGRYKNEKQYCDAIEELFFERGFVYEREKIIDKESRSKVDFIVENKIILEIKAKSFITSNDYFQVRRYLSDSGLKLGIIANMRQYNVLPKRVINSEID